MRPAHLLAWSFMLLVALPSFAVGVEPTEVPIPGTASPVAAGLVIGLSRYLRNERKRKAPIVASYAA